MAHTMASGQLVGGTVMKCIVLVKGAPTQEAVLLPPYTAIPIGRQWPTLIWTRQWQDIAVAATADYGPSATDLSAIHADRNGLTNRDGSREDDLVVCTQVDDGAGAGK